MLEMPLYVHMIFSYLAAVGFAVYLNSPKKTMYISGFIGMCSWIIYVVLSRAKFDVITSNLLASIFATTASEMLSRKMKKPTLLFIVPGVVTLVAGLDLYKAMSYLIEENYSLAIKTGSQAVLTSGAIASGVTFVSAIFRSYYTTIKHSKDKIKEKIQNRKDNGVKNS